jgi:hypothetical protein
MNVCMYICMCVCVCMYVHMCVCVCVCIHACTFLTENQNANQKEDKTSNEAEEE